MATRESCPEAPEGESRASPSSLCFHLSPPTSQPCGVIRVGCRHFFGLRPPEVSPPWLKKDTNLPLSSQQTKTTIAQPLAGPDAESLPIFSRTTNSPGSALR